MRIKEVRAEKLFDNRKETTISVFVKTEKGIFSCSSPSGKSKGKHEAKSYIKNVDGDVALIKQAGKEIEKINFSQFNDLEKVEKFNLGANSLYALEAALLKALAAENNLSLWELLNDKARKFPVPVGNIIGGGMHTQGSKPDFQEFLILPRLKKFFDNVFIMKKAHEIAGKRLEMRKSRGKLNDEGAWSTNLSNESCLEVLNSTREELARELDEEIEIGIDVAASSFYTGLIYNYKNPVKRMRGIDQINYLSELADKFMLSYIEDPLDEEAFTDFKILRSLIARKRPCLIVGDDLIVGQIERLKKALQSGSISAIIVKPNQNGSLLQIKKLIDLAKKYEVACVMSHRSGETLDYTIADLAFAFQCEFIKAGVIGREREVKLKRLIEIEKNV